MTIDTSSLIVQTAQHGLKLIRSDGGLSPGFNGPYRDKETPARNTSHWLIVFSKAYKITKNKKFKLAVKKLADYLTSNSVRPHQASFHHRFTTHKDKCNGLVGQAWTIEALVKASNILKNNKYTKLAVNVFLSHKFNKKKGLWHRLEIDGKTLPIDATLNHQIWFAASGSGLKNKTIHSQIKLFLDKLSDNMTVLDNGLIFHPIVPVWQKQIILLRLKNTILGNYDQDKINKKLIYKSIGYHAFNLYALAILRLNFPKHKFWKASSLRQSLEYCFGDKYKKHLIGNRYGFPYNPVGFEMPLIIQTFSKLDKRDKENLSAYWVNQQIKSNLDKNPDPKTLTARTYELTRSSNISLV